MPSKKNFRKYLWDYFGITLGVFITALGLDIFLIPNRLAAGGVSGLATVVFYTIGFPVGVTMAILNVFLFVAGVRIYGIKYGLKTIYGAFSLAFLVDILYPFLPKLVNEPFLGTLYGGILTGLGVGIVFLFEGNTGGTDIIAQILHKYVNLPLGQIFLLVDSAVMLLAGLAFGAKLALYGMIAVFISGRVIDLVQEGLSLEKAAYIISGKPQEIGRRILTELNRGVTSFPSRGLYTGKERETLFCVVSRRELPELKKLVREVDEKAFVIITDVREVVGEGFKRIPF